jgi:4-alpha-glucanotransferase
LLFHPTGLPGPHGSGDLGPAAYRFVDFLAAAGQRWWQMLPLGPVGPGSSPYSSPSAFAGNPLLISLERLAEECLLTADDLEPVRGFSTARVRYGAVTRYRTARLRKAFSLFQQQGGHKRAAFERFCAEQRDWLEDYALFCALRRVQRGTVWTSWDRELRLRRPAALRRACRQLREHIAYERFVQYLFARQWAALKNHCARRGVGLIGDLPIFVAHDSSDVWAHRDLFLLDAAGQPQVVSGVPPDKFSRAGQLWGHPLYRWERHQATRWRWWLARFHHTLAQYDAVRIDHFLGFNRCWAVPGRARTARHGRWLKSPGVALLSAIANTLGPVQIIAEDLGVVTREALALRDRFGFPGMRLLQFAFGDDAEARYHQPHNAPRRSVIYPGTHDNRTAVGWFRALRQAGRKRKGKDGLTERQRVLRYLGSTGREIHWDLIRLAYMSPANLAIIPVQDILGLDDSARMNTPATTRGNWAWRLPPNRLTAAIARRLRELTHTYERTGQGPPG